ncbi:MAG: hypothetical protein QOJ51_6199 [Acidobacteriaceae bacterium]|jgi:hypothetical protein|nr:hypothetical protein [Acidobacteriaceae bacterium]MEA2263374.1 hypothetical protein [Acidobacteriaceae bacterium]
MSENVETSDLTTGNTGIAIPQGFFPSLIDAQKAFGGIIKLVTKRNTDKRCMLRGESLPVA